MSNDINVVFDIVHGYELDIEDITELLEFRVALVPKTWTDNYGDTIKKTAHEVSNCLNSALNNFGKFATQMRWYKQQQRQLKKKKNNKKNNKN